MGEEVAQQCSERCGFPKQRPGRCIKTMKREEISVMVNRKLRKTKEGRRRSRSRICLGHTHTRPCSAIFPSQQLVSGRGSSSIVIRVCAPCANELLKDVAKVWRERGTRIGGKQRDAEQAVASIAPGVVRWYITAPVCLRARATIVCMVVRSRRGTATPSTASVCVHVARQDFAALGCRLMWASSITGAAPGMIAGIIGRHAADAWGVRACSIALM